MWKLNVLATDASDRTRLNGGVYKDRERMKRMGNGERADLPQQGDYRL